MMQDPAEAKINVLKGLIDYMRKLELGKDPEETAAAMDAMKSSHPANGMVPEEDETMEDEMAESPEEQHQEEESGEEEHPIASDFKKFLNDRHLPKIGSNVTMMVEAKKPMGKPMAAEIEVEKSRGRKKKYMR
jgi:hypothetical protein